MKEQRYIKQMGDNESGQGMDGIEKGCVETEGDESKRVSASQPLITTPKRVSSSRLGLPSTSAKRPFPSLITPSYRNPIVTHSSYTIPSTTISAHSTPTVPRPTYSTPQLVGPSRIAPTVPRPSFSAPIVSHPSYRTPSTSRPSRVQRDNLAVPTLLRHFKSPYLPTSITLSDFTPRFSPKTPPSSDNTSTLPPNAMSPLYVDCDLTTILPTSSYNHVDSFPSPLQTPHSPSTPITTSVSYSSSIPSQPIPNSIPNLTFYSSLPVGPTLFTSHSSTPLSFHPPPSLSSFRPTTVVVPAMEQDDQYSIKRYHLSMFLKYAMPPLIPDPEPPSIRKNHITHCEKTRAFILRANAFMAENGVEDLSPSLLSKLLSIHPQTVSRTIADASDSSPLNRFPPCAPPTLKQTKKDKEQRTVAKFSKETRDQLRKFMHIEFFAQFKRVTLKHINSRKEEWLAECDEGLSVNISTIRLLLHGMRFSFIKLQCRTNIYMNDYYCRLQANFLRRMQEIRKEGNNLIWSLDETWVHKGMRPNRGWQDLEAQESPLTFIKNGLTAGNSAQCEKGERLVIVACLSEFGFRCPLIWRTGKLDDGGDYHSEMNSMEFEKYVETVFKAIVKEAEERELRPVLLMDNASYHSRVIDKMPSTNDRKAVIADWLKSKGIVCPDGQKKKELIEKLKKFNRKDYNIYAVDTMAKSYGVTMVRTPPYMAEFAPIELGWSAMKRAQYDIIIRTDKGEAIRSKLLDWMHNYPESNCKAFMDHSKRKRISEGGLTFTPPSLSADEVVEAAVEIIDEDDEEPVEDLDDLFYMSDDEEESIRSVEF